jgi:FlaA1/EpsC-like NDP-sugar epimerase
MPSSKKPNLFPLQGLINLRNSRTSLAWLHDVSVAVLAWWLAYLLRFNFQIPANFVDTMWSTAAWVVPLQAFAFVMFGLYQGIWRFASMPDLFRIFKAIVFSAFAVAAVLVMFQPDVVVPRSILLRLERTSVVQQRQQARQVCAGAGRR